MTNAVVINPEENLQLELSNGLWQFCILNDFLSSNLSIEDCSTISIGQPAPSTGQGENESQNDVGPEALMAIVIAVIAIVSIVVLVVFITCRRKQYSQMKYLSNSDHFYCPKRFSPNQTSTKAKANPKELTLDASKEFAVTLMLRQPPEDNRFYKVDSNASDVYDTGYSGSSRQDSSLFI